MERVLTVCDSFELSSRDAIGLFFEEQLPAPWRLGPTTAVAVRPDGQSITTLAVITAALLTGGPEVLSLWIIGGRLGDFPAGTKVTFEDPD